MHGRIVINQIEGFLEKPRLLSANQHQEEEMG
jgi:hypothetical protein